MQVGSFFSSFLDAESDKEWKNKYIVIMQNYEKENAEELIEQELALIQLGK